MVIMKSLVIISSKNREGLTARAVNSLINSANDIEFEIIYLTELKILSCCQCDKDGWGKCKEGFCIIKDDFNSILRKMKKIDLFIFATPVYFGDISESLKSFLDRLRRISINKRILDIINKTTIGICVAGGGGGGSYECVIRLKDILTTCGFSVYDMIPVRRQNFEVKKEMLKTFGKLLKTNIS